MAISSRAVPTANFSRRGIIKTNGFTHIVQLLLEGAYHICGNEAAIQKPIYSSRETLKNSLAA
jgi:hypothetical protein